MLINEFGTLFAIKYPQINHKEVSQMKKLAAITAVGLVLGFSSSSFATDYMSLYAGDSVTEEVTDELTAGEIETSPMSFYINPVINKTGSDFITEAQNDENAILVFGVRI